jgi:hypothetical protein
MKTVNEQGLKEIRGYLSDLHKQETFTDAQLLAWATEVEESLNAGNPPEFEIGARDSKSGRVEICRIDDEGYDIEYFDMNPTPRGRNHHDRNDCERYACRICSAFDR